MEHYLARVPLPKLPIKKIAQTFGRNTQCQKSSNLTYFHHQILKQLLENLGHGTCHIDPTIIIERLKSWHKLC